MTREEKINTLKAIIQECEEYQWQRRETLFEIIKALEQEPCDDAISREAVKEQMIKYGFHAPDMTVTEFVEDLPPVKTQKNIVNYGTMNITL